MNCTLEKVLSDAKSLVERLRNHDNAAEMLIEQTTSLNKRVDAMKQVRCHCDMMLVHFAMFLALNCISVMNHLTFCAVDSFSCAMRFGCVLSRLQYQEEIDSLNQVARHRPRSSLVLGIQQENRQIRDLQQENKGRQLIRYLSSIYCSVTSVGHNYS